MPLFSRKLKLEVQSFILNLVNNNCPELKALHEGPRLEGRANLTVVVMVVPLEDNKLQIEQAFAAVTKEFSTSGLALVLSEPKPLDKVVIAFRWEAKTTFVQAHAKHLNPMGAGFYQIGLQMEKVVRATDYPELKSLNF